jgi:hypothetical protein
MDELARIKIILDSNKQKSFVDRILRPNLYPQLPLEGGMVGTHKMSWVRAGEKYHVFPTILWDGKELKQYKPMDAYKHVKTTGNYIEFDTPEDADWFSRNYKRVWEK